MILFYLHYVDYNHVKESLVFQSSIHIDFYNFYHRYQFDRNKLVNCVYGRPLSYCNQKEIHIMFLCKH